MITCRSWQRLSLWLAARTKPARQPHSLILFTLSLPKPLTERNLFPTISSRNLYAITRLLSASRADFWQEVVTRHHTQNQNNYHFFPSRGHGVPSHEFDTFLGHWITRHFSKEASSHFSLVSRYPRFIFPRTTGVSAPLANDRPLLRAHCVASPPATPTSRPSPPRRGVGCLPASQCQYLSLRWRGETKLLPPRHVSTRTILFIMKIIHIF